MKRTVISLLSLALLAGLSWGFSSAAQKKTEFALAKLTAYLLPAAQTARSAPRTRENFDIRAGLQRTLNDPADADVTLNERATSGDARTQARRSELPYVLRRAHPTVQMKWSSLTQAPSRVWSFNDSLSAPSNDAAEVIARRFLRNNADLLRLGTNDVAALQVARRYQDAHNGLTHLTLQQQLDGIEVFQAALALHLTKTGEVIALSGEALPNIAGLANAKAPRLTATEALRRAAADAEAEINETPSLKAQPVGAERKQLFDRASGFARDVEARLVYFPLSSKQVRLAWQFDLWVQQTPDVYLTLIDAEKGSLLYRHNLTCYDENPLKPHGPVYTQESPRPNLPRTSGSPAIVEREDLPFHAAPFNSGMIFEVSDKHYDWWAGAPADNLISNNTSTYLDRDATANQPDLPRLSAPDGNFTFPVDLAQTPTLDNNQKAAQVNLFYWINRYHDILYSFGFAEGAGNFQTDNFGLGGQGSDAVLGEAQDGSGTDNANFSTPADGRPGRVQMYLWSGTPQRDGDFDQGVILHEMTHGLSNRLIGNGGGLGLTQDRGMGEGWSDYFGLALLAKESDDPNASYPVGQFVINNYTVGIRRYPYSTSMAVNPLTYGDIRLSAEVHNVGEIWCNTLWEMRALLIQKYGFREGQRQALQLVVDGMKLSPIVPTFVDARNAIILADRVNNGSANQCLLWQAFAKRGLGFNAKTDDARDAAPVQAFESASYCSDTGLLALDKVSYVAGETLRLTLGDRNAAGAVAVQVVSSDTNDRETLTMAAENGVPGSFLSTIKLAAGRANPGDGVLQGSAESNDRITVTYNDPNSANGGPAQITATARFTREKIVFDDDIEQGNQGWLATGAWAITSTRAASGKRSWTDTPSGNYANNSDSSITSPLFDFSNLSEVTLTFASSIDAEDRFDYGVVEYSRDDGATWQRAANFTGTQTTFKQARLGLRALDGQARARVRFRFFSDAGIVADGWYVDDIRLTARSADPALVPLNGAPVVITAVNPAFGAPAGGTRVTISGASFSEDETTTVTFDGAPATEVNVLGGSTLLATAPPHASGAVTVRVTNRNGAAALAGGFTYYAPGSGGGAPTIATLFPNSGSTRGGTAVMVIGANFTPATEVSFGAQKGTTTFINSNTLRTLTPAATASGAVEVKVANGASAASLANAFSYTATSPPAVQVLSPNGGETFFARSVINLKWQSADNRAVARQRVSLMRNTGAALTFVSDIAAELGGETQALAWTIPANLQPTAQARIRVTAIDDEGAETEAFSSNDFTLALRWEPSALLPAALQRLQVASDGKALYAFGGRATSSSTTTVTTTQRLEPAVSPLAWTNAGLAPLPVAINGGEAVFLKGKIYLPGGINSAVQLSSAHFAYDPATNNWTTVAVASGFILYALAMDEARGVYHYTGGTTSTVPAAVARSYNPDTDRWSELPPLSAGRYGHEAAVIEGKLYIAGGIGTAGGLASAEVFDFDTRQWTPIAPLNRARAYAANVVSQDVAGNPLWLIIGGQDPGTGALLGTEVYDVRNNRWLTLDNSFTLPTQRLLLNGAVLGDYFYAVGGGTTLANSNRAVERLRLNSLTPTPLDQPPALAVPAAQVAVANTELVFTVSANDLGSGAPLTIQADGLPPGANFTTASVNNNSVRGTFRWVPAAAVTGQTFNVTFTTSDGQLSDVKVVSIRVVAAGALAAVNAADYRGGALAPDSIAALFGSALAVRTEVAAELPLPFELSGTTVTINGVRAPLFFVSPLQINFAVPAALQPGPATIIVSNPAGTFSAGTVQITSSVPALFTKDQTGRGDAIAIATVDGIRFQTAPFDVLVNGRPNILALFGTGVRRALAANPNDDNGVAEAVSVTIGGRAARVLFAGAQGGFTGLDQINVEMPAGLAGGAQRRVEVALAVNGDNANRVMIEIK